MSVSETSDLLALLEADHQRIEGLLEAGDPRALVRELSIHLVSEAHVMYPEARRADADADRLVDGALAVDHETEEALVELDRSGPEALAAVAGLFARHVEVQEGAVFPLLRRGATPERLAELGGALQFAMRGAPSRPHPHLPDEGPLAIVADALASRIDELRDAFREGREGGEH